VAVSSRWKDIALTRWREDATCDNWGTFCYLRDLASGEVLVNRTSADAQASAELRSAFLGGATEFRRTDFDLDTHTRSPFARG